MTRTRIMLVAMAMAIAAVAIPTRPAKAVILGAQGDLFLTVAGNPQILYQFFPQNPDGTYQYNQSTTIFILLVAAVADPEIDYDLTITNPSSTLPADIQFGIGIDMQNIPGGVASPWQMQHMVDVTLNDDDQTGGVTLDPTFGTIVTPFLSDDRNNFLYDPSVELVTSQVSGAGLHQFSSGLQAMTDIPGFYTTADHTVMGLNIYGQLSPGDSVQFQGRFEIVPEPATLSLLGVGALACFRGFRERRRAA